MIVMDTINTYSQEKLAPRVRKAFSTESTDREVFNEMGELGLLGLMIPMQNEEIHLATSPIKFVGEKKMSDESFNSLR